LPLAEEAWLGAAILAPRGKVLEDGRPRFFRRIARGEFDTEDLCARSAELAQFIRDACRTYGIGRPIAVGHSNGANIAWSVLFRQPNVLAGAILIRPFMAADPRPVENLRGLPILVLSGASDSIVPFSAVTELVELCRESGGKVSHHMVKGDHDIVPDDRLAISEWLRRTHRIAEEAARLQSPDG